MLTPLAKVEEADEPVMLRYGVERPEAMVEVALPCTTSEPVVVAPPNTVNPVEVAPPPMVVEPVRRPLVPKILVAVRAVEEAYGNTFAAEAVEVIMSEMSSVEESVAAPVSASVPWRMELPVVVAPPKMVRPPICVPSPMVEEAVERRPVDCQSVEVAAPHVT
jgi:hypothetical protein